MITQELNARIAAAHQYLGERGWTQEGERDDAGRVCLSGAIVYCAPQNGDEHLIRAVLGHQGYDEDWNDDPQRTEDEVRDFLANFEITETDLETTFGPHWVEVVQLARQAATLTPHQVQQIARHATLDAARHAALGAALNAALGANRNWDAAEDAAWDAAEDAAGDPDLDATRYDAKDAAGYAGLATVTQDLISPEHHRALMGPWRSAFPDT